MRVYLKGLTPDQQQRLVDGVTQILDAGEQKREEWSITGTPNGSCVESGAPRWLGRINKPSFDRELLHVLGRFRDWLADIDKHPYELFKDSPVEDSKSRRHQFLESARRPRWR